MYLFLSALSVSEILVTVTIMLRMLDHLLSTHHSITFVACATQIFSFKFGYAHSFLLMVMDYDHYVAICYSLHYSALLSPTCYAHPVAWSWAGGSVMGMIMTSVVYHLTFCESPCDLPHSQSCVFPLEFGLWRQDGLCHHGCDPGVCHTLIGCLSLIILFCIFIVATILRVPSPEGWHKTSPCVSHLIMVVVH